MKSAVKWRFKSSLFGTIFFIVLMLLCSFSCDGLQSQGVPIISPDLLILLGPLYFISTFIMGILSDVLFGNIKK